MKTGYFHIGKLFQPFDYSSQHAVFIAVAESPALLFHESFLRAEGGNVAVDAKPHRKTALREAAA